MPNVLPERDPVAALAGVLVEADCGTRKRFDRCLRRGRQCVAIVKRDDAWLWRGSSVAVLVVIQAAASAAGRYASGE
jgi:hypothetical protein